MTVRTERLDVATHDGWKLALYRTSNSDRRVPGRRPVMIVPGYGMNSFIFSYHPNGMSLEGYLVEQGFEVFRVDLRGQGESAYEGTADAERFSLRDLAITDLSAVIDAAISQSDSGQTKIDVIGASLGGTLMFIHAVMLKENKLGSLVALGSPVRWIDAHPILRVAFRSRTLAGMVKFRGTRALAAKLLPHVVRMVPWLLSVYLNPKITDTEAAGDLVKTVEDPNRHINREIAGWIRTGDLVIDGVRIGEQLADLRQPFLCVYGNGDGIVPKATATWPYQAIGSRDRTLLEVGDRLAMMAHADMFISREAERQVFEPLAKWLAAR